jgi:DNA polymerase
MVRRWLGTFGVSHVLYDLKSTTVGPPPQETPHHNHISEKFENMEELKRAVLDLNCHLKRTAKNTVFADGLPDSRVMIIGEAPGQEEDEQGRPFVGQSGKLLDNMLMAVGIDRSEVYISNVVFWRPPGNRTPSTEEIALCMPYVREHVRLVHPKVLLLLGGVAVKSVLSTNEPISRMRGRPQTYEGIPTVVTFHPAYLLRSPSQKQSAFFDLIMLRKLLSQ